MLQNLSEVRASTVEKAALYLDAALSARSHDTQGRQAHLLYTLHVYQYSLNGPQGGAGGVAGGRSRLHLLDLGGFDRSQGTGGLTLSGLGNVLIGIFNGQKHLPCRHSKLTGVLRECLGSLTCHATMLAHVSAEPARYAETLHTLQLAARIHRMRRKRVKPSGGGSRGSGSSEERARARRQGSGSSGSDFTSATSTDPSSSEMSCSTVIFRGSVGALSEEGSGTDGEHPPPLGGGVNRLKSRRFGGGSRILTNGTISPSSSRLTLSPSPMEGQNGGLKTGFQSPRRGLTPTLPPIKEFNGHYSMQPSRLSPPTGQIGRMPLNGQVPGYRQPAEIWIDGHCRPGPTFDRPASHRSSPSAGLAVNYPDMTVAAVSAAGAGQQAAAVREGGSYGYMDDYKASMICSWVETQADAKFLTQFKQAADSSDSGSEHHTAAAVTTEIRADVHTPHMPTPSPPLPTPAFQSTEKDMSPVTALPAIHNSSKRGTPPVPPPRRSPSLVLSNSGGGGGETVAAARLERPASADSMEPLPEPDFEALDSCRLPSGNYFFCSFQGSMIFKLHTYITWSI